MKFNPFKPGAIIHPGMFSGRYDELTLLERSLFQTAEGNPEHLLIHGERGIGKSSLLTYMNWMAEGSLSSLNDHEFKFLTVNIELHPQDTYAEIIGKVARELERVLERSEPAKALLKDAWDFITRWKVLGVEYTKSDPPPPVQMLEELSEKVATIAQKIAPTFQGIYVFIDEADKPPASANLGEFVKVLSERLTKRGANNVCIVVSGISNVIERMRKSHESSPRIFTIRELVVLESKDRQSVVVKGLDEAKEKSGVEVTISQEALDLIDTLSEGYPHFIQQYAYSAFDQDSDNNIDIEDVRQALRKKNGALQLLGSRYFENMYSEEIKSESYRKVLLALAKHAPDYMSRAAIAGETGLKAITINNALTACKARGSVVAKKGTLGQYKLPSRSFAAWILAYKSLGKPN